MKTSKLDWRRVGRDAVFAVGGPVAAGVCLSPSLSPTELLPSMLFMPLAVVGAAVVMLPALYIGGALLGVAPPATEVFAASASALRDVGIVLLGLAPALAFLASTAAQRGTVLGLGHAAVGLAALLSLGALYRRLFAGAGGPLVPMLYAGWAMVALGIGWRFFVTALSGGGAL